MEDVIVRLRNEVQEKSPLIHNITNVVVTNFTANGLYAIGASPVMAYAHEEVADMAKIAQAVMLNIGTLTATEVEAMFIAGRSANEHGVPVVLDPVGVGATSYRTETAKALLADLSIAVARGNAGEIANLVDEQVEMKGVDSSAKIADLATLAKKAAVTLNTVVVMTGETDIITDGETTYECKNGDPMLAKVTGTGCLLSSVVAAFCSQGKSNLVEACAAAVGFYGIAAEVAAELTASQGPGHFQIHFLDQLYKVGEGDIRRLAKVKRVEG